jgi:hypothetical protein
VQAHVFFAKSRRADLCLTIAAVYITP